MGARIAMTRLAKMNLGGVFDWGLTSPSEHSGERQVSATFASV
jgi:hypothetical protein